MCCYIFVQLIVFNNPLTKYCSFFKANPYLYWSFCVLICTFLSTICWVYSPPGSHPCHVTLSATSIPKWLTLRCVWTGMVNFNALAKKINKEFPLVRDTVINSAGVETKKNLSKWTLPVKPGKPWTPEIFLECYCAARKKPIRCEKTKLQARTLVFGLWFALMSWSLLWLVLTQ